MLLETHGCPVECTGHCSPGYVCNCTGRRRVIAAVRKRTALHIDHVAFVREASNLMTTRLSLKDIQRSFVDFVESGRSCCNENCISNFLEASDEVARLGGGYDLFPKAILAARMSVYIQNQNKAAENLRNILVKCCNPSTNRTDYRFFHMGQLGDANKGVPSGFPVRTATNYMSRTNLFLLIEVQSTGVFQCFQSYLRG